MNCSQFYTYKGYIAAEDVRTMLEAVGVRMVAIPHKIYHALLGRTSMICASIVNVLPPTPIGIIFVDIVWLYERNARHWR